MTRGPLPTGQAVRRNAPSHAGKALPASGRVGRPPKPPVELGESGMAWWRWAWTTPQAVAWDKGSLYAIAHRAQLEDDLAVMDAPEDDWDFADMFGKDPAKAERDIKWLVARLRSLAGDRVKVTKAMNDLDDRLGLNSKSAAQLRWAIETEEPAEEGRPAEVRRLKVVDKPA